jgi:hypothetical protein
MMRVAAATTGEFATGREHIVPDHDRVGVVFPDAGIPDFYGPDHIIGEPEMVFSAGVVGGQVDAELFHDGSDDNVALVANVI